MRVGSRHDLHQRDARAIEIDVALGGREIMHRSARVLLQMQPLDADRDALRRRHVDRHDALADNRLFSWESDRPAADRDKNSFSDRTRIADLFRFRPRPVRIACRTRPSLMTGNMPGIAASTSRHDHWDLRRIRPKRRKRAWRCSSPAHRFPCL